MKDVSSRGGYTVCGSIIVNSSPVGDCHVAELASFLAIQVLC